MASIFDTLPGKLGAKANALVAKREEDGRNVHFTREDGTEDRFSFATNERADAFRAKVRRQGMTVTK